MFVFPVYFKSRSLSALGVATIRTDQATFLVNEAGGSAFLAFLLGLSLGTIGDVLLKGALNPGFPCID